MFRHLILYVLVQAGIAYVFIVEMNHLMSLVEPIVICYWVFSVLSICMFLAVQLKNVRECLMQPGYTQDFHIVIPSDQEQVPGRLISQNAIEKRRAVQSQPELVGSLVGHAKVRTCIICHSIQPLRTKHCHDCNKCVLTFDHHCPFMGTCIGEKNRAIFYCYLLVQATHLSIAVAFIHRILCIHKLDYPLALLFVAILAMAGIIVALLFFHTYLMFSGFTTWQFFSWKNITYLNSLTRRTNPFTQGFCNKIKTYWKPTFSTDAHMWDFLI